MDWVEIAMLGLLALAFLGLGAAVFWPDRPRRADVMSEPHGDQPRLPQ